VSQAIESLVDPGATHAQQAALWKQLVASGKLDETIATLERRISENPNAPADLSRLGHAYLLKAGTTKDYGELASLGLKIDQTLDQSLKQDANSWEARFDKADSMSHWPAYLGKDKEVVERFLALIHDQETQAPQPQFAQTYLKLGEQYQKLGRADYARETWQRGAALFPQDPALQGFTTGQSQ
jgi:tetratricopeptide (TPR) repeat protein